MLPFQSDPVVKADYMLFNDPTRVRIGKILEDLDAIAGLAAYRHCDDADPDTAPPTIVTASCDRIEQLAPELLSQDIRCDAVCTWVGQTSMNVEAQLTSTQGSDLLLG